MAPSRTSSEDERALLEDELPDRAPWEPIASDLPEGGPARLWRGREAMAFVASVGRAEAERAGVARLGDHPARPAVIATKARSSVLAFAPWGSPVDDPIAAVLAWPGTTRRIAGTRRALLTAIGDEVNLPRTLGRLTDERGEPLVRRRDLDRWLAEEIEIETEVGPSFGGAHPGWLRVQGDRAVCLRCDRVRLEGWRAIDLAGLSLAGIDEGALRDAQKGESDARDVALELALIAVWTREHVRSRDAALAMRLRERIAGERTREPDRVRVWIEGPPFVDVRAWNAPGEEVSASRARWLLAHLDGLAVGGGQLRVRTEPAIRAGRRAPPREDRDERRRRLFARWDQGVRADDEGLLSATPEALARRIAKGARGVVLDGTCGVGALAIAYAREPAVSKVIAVDLDEGRLAMARHNARIYGVADRIDFRRGDVVELAGRTRADLLVLDPPWGGRSYDRERVALDELGLDVSAVLARFRGPLVLKLPRSFDPATLPEGRWRIEAVIDERGILKMLIARRDELS